MRCGLGRDANMSQRLRELVLDAVGCAGAVPLIMRRLSADALPSERTVGPDCEARLIAHILILIKAHLREQS